MATARVVKFLCLAVCASTLAMAPVLAPQQAFAADPEAIVRALQPKPKVMQQTAPLTRSFAPAPTRGIAIEGGAQTEDAVPSIDLYVPFEYDQSSLTMSDAQLAVDSLGKALKDPRLATMRFQIVGHTDARGGDDYNAVLSQKRADAVRSRLIQFHGVAPDRLTAEGRGRRELKDPQRPEDAINRRVQVKTVVGATS